VYVLLEFWQKIMAIPIMNLLSWFIYDIYCDMGLGTQSQDWLVHAPQRLMIETPISQYASYTAMFCLLQGKNSMKAPLQSIQPLWKYIRFTCEAYTHVLMCESRNTLISVISNSFHSIIAVRSICNIYVLH